MNIVVASDHAGFSYKISLLTDAGFNPVDLGTYDTMVSDYPDHAETKAYQKIRENKTY